MEFKLITSITATFLMTRYIRNPLHIRSSSTRLLLSLIFVDRLVEHLKFLGYIIINFNHCNI